MADPTSAVTMAGAEITGRQVAEASHMVVMVRLTAEVAPADPRSLGADVRMKMKGVALVARAEGVQETLEAEVAPTARTEEEIPSMKVTTTGEGVAVFAPN